MTDGRRVLVPHLDGPAPHDVPESVDREFRLVWDAIAILQQQIDDLSDEMDER